MFQTILVSEPFMVSTIMEGRIEGLEKTMDKVKEEIGKVRYFFGQF